MKKRFALIIGGIVLGIIIVSLGIILFATGSVKKNPKPDFLLVNGTGTPITQIEIKPSRRMYPDNEDVWAFKDIDLNDQEIFAVFINKGDIEYFDIAIRYSSGLRRNAKTKEKEGIYIANIKNMPVYVLHISGRESTVPLVISGLGAGGTAAGIGALAAALKAGTIVIPVLGEGIAAAPVLAGLKLIGGVVGGGLTAGVGVVAAVPVAVGAAIFTATTILGTDTLLVTQLSYD